LREWPNAAIVVTRSELETVRFHAAHLQYLLRSYEHATHCVLYTIYQDQVDFPYFKRFTEKTNSPAKKDKIYIDDELLKIEPPKTKDTFIIALNKPVNITCTTDPNDRTNVIRFLNHPKRIFPIGRLDKDSEGLLLLTTDKRVTRLLFQGKQPHKRTYVVQVKNVMTEETAVQLSAGISISAAKGLSFITTPCSVELIDKPIYIQDA
jgi:16S rRNA U516 pseudouridylate synthase RsuA-like enzyme